MNVTKLQRMNLTWLLSLSIILLMNISSNFTARCTNSAPENAQHQVFFAVPAPLNVTIGGEAVFSCCANGDSVYFTINNMSVNRINDTNILEDVGATKSGVRTRILRIRATDDKYNESIIQCISYTSGEQRPEVIMSDPVILLVQGLLDAVGDPKINLINGTLCFSWIPPFTFNITDVDHDLYYIIEITNTEDAEDHFTVSCDDCSEYKFTANSSSPCDSFTFVVIPVNGAGNGTPSDPLLGSFIQEPPELIPITDVTVNVLQDDELMIDVPYPSTAVCLFQLTFDNSDGLDPPFSCQIELSADIDVESLTLVVQTGSSCQPFTLPLNRVFDMGIQAQNSAGSTTLAERVRLSTHDAQDAIVAVGPMPGTVTVSVTYAVNTSAMGYLTILVNSSNIAVAFIAPDRSSQVTIIRGLLADMYTALVFDVESSGLPSTAAADSEVISVDEGSDESQPTDSNLIAEVEVNPNSDICTSCTFATSNSVGCVVIMYSATTQLVVHSISREDPSESSERECFTVPFGDYTVAVFNRESDNMIALNPATVSYVTVTASSPTPSPTSRPSDDGLPPAAVIGIAIGAVIIVLCGILVCLIYWSCKSHSEKTGHERLLRTPSTFSSRGSSIRSVQLQTVQYDDGASPFIGRALPDGNEALETPLSGTEEHPTTNTATSFGHGSLGYATIGPAASPGPKTVDYTQLDLAPGENRPPLIDPVPYQTVQVEAVSAKIKTTKYVELDLPPNDDPPPQADTVTYQTVKPKSGENRPPSIDPVPYQTVQVEAVSAEIKTTKYAELDLPPNDDPPPQADTVTYQTVKPKSGVQPQIQHTPLLLPARTDSHSCPVDEQLQSTPSPLPTPVDVSPVPPQDDDLPEARPSPRQSPSSPHAMMREPSYSPPDTPEEAPNSSSEESLHLSQSRRAPPPPPTNSYLPTHALREEPPWQPSRRRSPPPPPIGELPPYSPLSSHPPPYTPPLTPRSLFSSPPIEFHGTMV